MEAATVEVTKIIDQSLAVGRGRADIEATLLEKGFELSAFANHIEDKLQQHAAKRRSSGHILVAAGITTCFASCVITLISGSMGAGNFTLIGLTSVGIALLFAGLMKIF